MTLLLRKPYSPSLHRQKVEQDLNRRVRSDYSTGLYQTELPTLYGWLERKGRFSPPEPAIDFVVGRVHLALELDLAGRRIKVSVLELFVDLASVLDFAGVDAAPADHSALGGLAQALLQGVGIALVALRSCGAVQRALIAKGVEHVREVVFANALAFGKRRPVHALVLKLAALELIGHGLSLVGVALDPAHDSYAVGGFQVAFFGQVKEDRKHPLDITIAVLLLNRAVDQAQKVVAHRQR